MFATVSIGFALATAQADPYAAEFDALLDQAAAQANDAGVVLEIRGGFLPAPYVGARGAAPGASLRIASNTKTFTAAAVLRLVEQGAVDLDAPVTACLDAEWLALLAADGYALNAITIRHLLQHTAGLADHAQTDAYLNAVFSEPARVWSRAEQIAFAAAHADPVGAPGERFAYSDTGYVILGAVIEQVSGRPMAEAIRALVGYDVLGLEHTWFETLEPAPDNAPARLAQTIDGMTVADIHASADLYGGGGLVSTLSDLARLYEALGEGALFPDGNGAGLMMTASPQSLAAHEPYGMGVQMLEVERDTCFGHGGFWGTLAYYCPFSGIAVAGAVTDPAGYGALRDLVEASVRIAALGPNRAPD